MGLYQINYKSLNWKSKPLKKFSSLGGTRTHDLWATRPLPYYLTYKATTGTARGWAPKPLNFFSGLDF